MDEEGMTDLQFKSYLRKIIFMLEDAGRQGTLEKTREKLDRLREELQIDIQA